MPTPTAQPTAAGLRRILRPGTNTAHAIGVGIVTKYSAALQGFHDILWRFARETCRDQRSPTCADVETDAEAYGAHCL